MPLFRHRMPYAIAIAASILMGATAHAVLMNDTTNINRKVDAGGTSNMGYMNSAFGFNGGANIVGKLSNNPIGIGFTANRLQFLNNGGGKAMTVGEGYTVSGASGPWTVGGFGVVVDLSAYTHVTSGYYTTDTNFQNDPYAFYEYLPARYDTGNGQYVYGYFQTVMEDRGSFMNWRIDLTAFDLDGGAVVTPGPAHTPVPEPVTAGLTLISLIATGSAATRRRR